jgi:hypothetical protein
LGVNVSEKDAVSNGLGDLVEAALEPAHSAEADMVLGCAPLERVIDGGILAEDVTIAEAVDFVAGFTVVGFVLEEPKGKCALGVVILHIFGG